MSNVISITRNELDEALVPRIGQLLDNGAVVIDIYRHDASIDGDPRPQGVVLAMITHPSLPRGAEFVTWDWIVERARCITVTGTYRSHVFDAAKDFARRIARLGDGDE